MVVFYTLLSALLRLVFPAYVRVYGPQDSCVSREQLYYRRLAASARVLFGGRVSAWAQRRARRGSQVQDSQLRVFRKPLQNRLEDATRYRREKTGEDGWWEVPETRKTVRERIRTQAIKQAQGYLPRLDLVRNFCSWFSMVCWVVKGLKDLL